MHCMCCMVAMIPVCGCCLPCFSCCTTERGYLLLQWQRAGAAGAVHTVDRVAVHGCPASRHSSCGAVGGAGRSQQPQLISKWEVELQSGEAEPGCQAGRLWVLQHGSASCGTRFLSSHDDIQCCLHLVVSKEVAGRRCDFWGGLSRVWSNHLTGAESFGWCRQSRRRRVHQV